MSGFRYVVALGDFIIEAPVSEGQARTLLSLLRVLYVDYLGVYCDYRGVIINVGKLAHRLALSIIREFNIECGEGGIFPRPCLVIYDAGLDVPPMVFRVSEDASFEEVLRGVLRRGFISVAGDLHVGVTYAYKKRGRLMVGDYYFKTVIDGGNIYIEYEGPGEV